MLELGTEALRNRFSYGEKPQSNWRSSLRPFIHIDRDELVGGKNATNRVREKSFAFALSGAIALVSMKHLSGISKIA